MKQTTVGFRVKSGWASAVLLAGPVEAPVVQDHRVISLSDPTIPETKQPFHAAQGILEQDSPSLARRLKLVQRTTERSVRELLRDYSRTEPVIRNAGLAVGSLIEPDSISNPHIRAHALEGRLFRNALENALRSEGLKSIIISERNGFTEASVVLGQPEGTLKQRVSDFGGHLRKPWRADEKLAVLAAWVAMARESAAKSP